MVKGPGAVMSKPRTAIRRGSRDATPDASATPASAGATPDVFPAAPGGGQQPAGASAPRPAGRRALKNWRVRSRLIVLVIIPTVTAVAAGGAFIATSVGNALTYQRVLTMAELNGKITGLVQALQNEREDTVQYIVLSGGNGGRGAPVSVSASSQVIPAGPELDLLSNDYAATTGWADQVKTLASGIGGSYPALEQGDAQAAITAIGDLPAIRSAATTTQIPAQSVITEYALVISTLLDAESQIGVGSSDSTLAGDVRVLGLISSMKEQASQQQALLTSSLASNLVNLGTFGPSQQTAITEALTEQQGDLEEFDTVASGDQQQVYNNALSGTNVVQAQSQEQQAISLASSGSTLATDPTISDASSALSYVVGGMRSAEEQFADATISRSQTLHNSAITSTILFSLAVILLLTIALIATTLIGRSMVRPLRRLRNEALDIAGTRLPQMVQRMSETDGETIPLEVEPIDVDSSDEIGEVARAFDQVHREAVRLAANEAALRGNVNAMFVNLSRRSQSLVERQIRVITRLEQSEQDSKRLASLFLMDHLATRMRRNSENLLVLAGHELTRRWSRPVALVDVLRAAVSEIDQYERVTLNVQNEILVRMEAVSDVVHLTAELVENAASFSADKTPVTIAAYLPSSGGAIVEITDQGVGMPAEEMARANTRLDNPPVVDVAVSRRMGLFVVARLAARHGIRVRLRPVPTGGLIALIWLPDEVIMQQGSASPARPGAVAAAPNRAAIAADDEFTVSSNRAAVANDEFGAGGRWDSFTAPAPAPAAAAMREQVGQADQGQQAPMGIPVRDREQWAAAGSLPNRNEERMRTAEQRAGSRLRDIAPGQGGDQPLPAAQPNGFSGAGLPQRMDGPPQRMDGLPQRMDGLPPDAEELPQRMDGPLQYGEGLPQRADIGQAGNPVLPQRADIGQADIGQVGNGQVGNGQVGNGSAQGWEGLPNGAVAVPAAENPADRERLPIFDSVESHWFNRGRSVMGRLGQGAGSWSSPADDGWRAAEVAHAPTTDGTTTAGLPKRVPNANLVPGTAAAAAVGSAGGTSPEPLPERSATETAGRYASYQDGIRQGRAAVSGGNPDNREGLT